MSKTIMYKADKVPDSWTVQDVIDKCEEYHFSYNMIGDNMFVKTAVGSWYFSIFDKSGCLKLYHSNMFYNYYSKNKFGNNYHVHEKRYKNPLAALEYIYYHDCKNYSYMKKSKNKKYDLSFKKSSYIKFA